MREVAHFSDSPAHSPDLDIGVHFDRQLDIGFGDRLAGQDVTRLKFLATQGVAKGGDRIDLARKQLGATAAAGANGAVVRKRIFLRKCRFQNRLIPPDLEGDIRAGQCNALVRLFPENLLEQDFCLSLRRFRACIAGFSERPRALTMVNRLTEFPFRANCVTTSRKNAMVV